jgi:hypothetical protein
MLLSFDLVKPVFVCASKSCQKYLNTPVTLPCGSTVCREHLEPAGSPIENVKINCDLCEIEHNIPAKYLAFNHTLSDLMEKDIHLSPEQKEIKANVVQMEAILMEHEKSKLANPEEYIYDYFANIRNKIDLHRGKSIESIHKRYEELIEELDKIEKDCIANNDVNMRQLTFKTQEIVTYKEFLRDPDVGKFKNDVEWGKLINPLVAQVKTSLLDFQSRIQAYKSELLMNQTIDFESDDNIKTFGSLNLQRFGDAFSQV